MKLQINWNGIRLRRLAKEDLELVRKWRNANHVRELMEYQSYISSEAQAQWFQQHNTSEHFHFLMENAGHPFGLVSCARIRWDEKCGDAGIFVGDLAYHNSILAVHGVLSMMDVMFGLFGLEKLYAKIKVDNQRAIHFNKMLGYQACPNQEKEDFHWYEVGRSRYFQFTQKLRKVAHKQEYMQIEWEGDELAERFQTDGFSERLQFDPSIAPHINQKTSNSPQN